uniref:NHS like 3 n=1 Tax=Acanthochromis polyacanthus TaxID=80966 RepID=A0A3Q1GJ87_9TELE
MPQLIAAPTHPEAEPRPAPLGPTRDTEVEDLHGRSLASPPLFSTARTPALVRGGFLAERLKVIGNEDQKRLTVHYTASQHYQENVFIEGSRPQYLEDLHTEAQEGLKILQQEGTPRTEVALRSSTFKPLNPVKRIDKSRKRSRRTTIMGIPNQVQKELGMSTASSLADCVVIIPTVDGGTPVTNKEGARVHLSELEVKGSLERLKKHLQAVYQDEQCFNQQGFGSHLCPTSSLRPKSLAVPGMTTLSSFSPSMFSFLQEPQGPVMSISPQATYLSTIIPNAVLPASIEVIEIDRSSSRTKSSLASGDSVSPLLSRRSDGDGSQTYSSFNDSALMPTSTSGSNWSESQSSKTIISNSSPISSKSSTRTGSSQKADLHRNCTRSLSVMKTKQPPAPPQRTNSLHSNKIRANSKVLVDSKDLIDSTSDEVKSVIENNATTDDRNLVKTDNSNIVATVSNSAGSSMSHSSSTHLSPTQASSNEAGGANEVPSESSTSSPQKTPSEGGKFERTMSPSSGYSSQSGTPTLSPKGISPPSPDKHKKKPVKPERLASRASSSAASPSSSLTSLSSGTSELANADVPPCSPNPPPQGSPPTVAPKEVTQSSNPSTFSVEIRELLDIPPPPKVKAPCPPPPETWIHNRRTFELLCGPYPNVVQKPAQIQDSTDKQAGVLSEARKEMQVLEESQTCPGKPVSELPENKGKPEEVYAAQESRECPGTSEMKPSIQEKRKSSVDEQRQEQSCSSVVKDTKNQETTPKKDPPPVMKKPVTIVHREEMVLAEHSLERHLKEMSSSATTQVLSSMENRVPSSQNGVTSSVESENEMDRSEVPCMQTLSVEVPKMNKVSPPPTPPPAYHPTPPLSRKTSPSSISVPSNELQRVQEESHTVESCWPPPPPPMEGDSVFDGGDEVDFPPPPPPLITDSVPDVMDSCGTDLNVPNGHTVQNPDLQPAENENEPVVVVHVSKPNNEDEISCQLVQNVSSVSDSISPPPVESPPIVPIRRAESPVSVMVEVPPSISLKRSSLRIEDQSPSALPASNHGSGPSTVPTALALPAENLTHGVNFRRQPSVGHRDARSKELLSRHKSAPIPKEDANIPLVTPSLLQMVRLRSVNMTEDQVKAPSEDKLGVRSNTYSCFSEPGAVSLKLPEGCDMHKSPASTASFIFSRSTKKVVIETVAASSPEAQASLKQSLAAELMQVSDQSKAAAFSNGEVKCDKVPPPVAKKPAHVPVPPQQSPFPLLQIPCKLCLHPTLGLF